MAEMEPGWCLDKPHHLPISNSKPLCRGSESESLGSFFFFFFPQVHVVALPGALNSGVGGKARAHILKKRIPSLPLPEPALYIPWRLRDIYSPPRVPAREWPRGQQLTRCCGNAEEEGALRTPLKLHSRAKAGRGRRGESQLLGSSQSWGPATGTSLQSEFQKQTGEQGFLQS